MDKVAPDNGDFSNNDKSLIDRYVSHFSDENNKKLPEYFEPSVIDVFLRVLSDAEGSDDIRSNAALIMNKLLRRDNSLVHTIVEKGALGAFIDCIATAHETCLIHCVRGMIPVLRHCAVCKKKVARSALLETMANRMNYGSSHSCDFLDSLLAVCRNLMKSGKTSMSAETGRLLLSGIVNAMRPFEDEDRIHRALLVVVILMTFEKNFAEKAHISAYIDAMLNNTDLMSIALSALASGIPDNIETGLLIFANIASFTGAGSSQLYGWHMKLDGFMNLLINCLGSPEACVRGIAAELIGYCGSTRAAFAHLMQEVNMIALLIPLLGDDNGTVQAEVCHAFAMIFVSLSTRPVLSMNDLIGHGVRAMVDIASKSGADDEVVKMIRETLPHLLKTHPHFYYIADESVTLKNPNTRMLRCWRILKKKVSAFVMDGVELSMEMFRAEDLEQYL